MNMGTYFNKQQNIPNSTIIDTLNDELNNLFNEKYLLNILHEYYNNDNLLYVDNNIIKSLNVYTSEHTNLAIFRSVPQIEGNNIFCNSFIDNIKKYQLSCLVDNKIITCCATEVEIMQQLDIRENIIVCYEHVTKMFNLHGCIMKEIYHVAKPMFVKYFKNYILILFDSDILNIYSLSLDHIITINCVSVQSLNLYKNTLYYLHGRIVKMIDINDVKFQSKNVNVKNGDLLFMYKNKLAVITDRTVHIYSLEYHLISYNAVVQINYKPFKMTDKILMLSNVSFINLDNNLIVCVESYPLSIFNGKFLCGNNYCYDVDKNCFTPVNINSYKLYDNIYIHNSEITIIDNNDVFIKIND